MTDSKHDVRERGIFHRLQFRVQGATEADCDERAWAKIKSLLTDPAEWTITSKLMGEESVQSQDGSTVVTLLTCDYIVVRMAGEMPWMAEAE